MVVCLFYSRRRGVMGWTVCCLVYGEVTERFGLRVCGLRHSGSTRRVCFVIWL